ncbi:MAG TPA: prenyltransferase [Streptosporangiaceae bacterium]|nr:prenyltransferase [Streptosporangiaceae bacterium]
MRQPERLAGSASFVPELPGILSADQLIATGRSIEAGQQSDGSIGWPDGHVDSWNHVECAMALSVCGLRDAARRAYTWLAQAQQPDGSWPVQSADGGVREWTTESNHAAYCAVGVWHELLVTGDDEFAEQMWPIVRAAIEFAIGLQTARGEIIWRRHEDGTPDNYALLTGSSSMYTSLRCAIALAERMSDQQPDWELAAALLGHAVACHGEAFADKSRFSMDWYYPVLGGPVRGPAAERMLKAGWDTFVVPGIGVRCVSDEPWVTGAETCELAIALEAMGQRDLGMELFEQVQFLRDPAGGYWTGWQFANQRHYPNEQSHWTGAAMVLAADTLASGATGESGAVSTPAAGIFREVAAGPGVWRPSDPEVCGCEGSSVAQPGSANAG